MEKDLSKKIEKMLEMNEAVDVKTIIKELMKTDFKGENAEQMKGLQLLKGLATSEDELSNKFIAQLSDAYTKIGKSVLGGGGDNE